MESPIHTVLFICTANYYRSRLAEEVFNLAAAELGLRVRAESAGFLADHYRFSAINPGTMSRYALEALSRFGLTPLAAARAPRQFAVADLKPGVMAIALSRTEHYPMAVRLFPATADTLQYWEIEDIGYETPESATQRIKELATELATRLSVG